MQTCSEEYSSNDEDLRSPDSDHSVSTENDERHFRSEDEYGNLPLEVITTVEHTNLDYQGSGNHGLKKLSNGVLTVRNIFSSHERETLRKIIEKYRYIVDTRSRTREIYIEKQNVWEEIVDEYNRTENIMARSQKELRKCWDNMKYRAKQAEKEGKSPNEELKSETNGYTLGKDVSILPNDMLTLKPQGEELRLPDKLTVTPVKSEPCDDLEKNNLTIAENAEENPTDHFLKSASKKENSSLFAQDGMDDDSEPALKKARQESPKLSSLLLAGARKSPKKSPPPAPHGTFDSMKNLGYSIPSCTKVLQVKKKIAAEINGCEPRVSPVSIIPTMSLTSAVPASLPAPKQTSINLGSGVTLTSQPAPHITGINGMNGLKPTLNNVNNSKILPNLKKMMNGIDSESLLNKAFSGFDKFYENDYLINGNANMINGNANMINGNANLMNGFLQTPPEASSLDQNVKDLQTRLLRQRIEFEQEEHRLKLRMLEKQLIAQNSQAQYWSTKLKLLRSGKDFFDARMEFNGQVE